MIENQKEEVESEGDEDFLSRFENKPENEESEEEDEEYAHRHYDDDEEGEEDTLKTKNDDGEIFFEFFIKK